MDKITKNFRKDLNFCTTMHTSRISITPYRLLVKAHTLDLFPEVHRVRFNSFHQEKKEVLFIHYNHNGDVEKLIYSLDTLNYKFKLESCEPMPEFRDSTIRLVCTNYKLIGFE